MRAVVWVRSLYQEMEVICFVVVSTDVIRDAIGLDNSGRSWGPLTFS